MDKNAISVFAVKARRKLISSASDKAGMLGISSDKCSEPISKGTDFEIYKTIAGTEVTLNKLQCDQRKVLVSQIEQKGYESVIEEVAYTWFNRICAIRFMEVNDYLPNRVRILSSEKNGKSEPDIITAAPNIDFNLSEKDKELVIEYKMNNKLDELFIFLFIKQCNKLHDILPDLFEKTSDYTEMLLQISYTNEDDVIRMLVDEIDEADFCVSDNGDGIIHGQEEIIGWLYQYYISEPKDELINAHKKYGNKDIPFVTQLFTSDWIVKFIVDNSLGRYYIENNGNMSAEMNLDYYLEQGVRTKSSINIEKIKVIDPCMGSGHMLVYAFDVLLKMYLASGYTARDASILIIKNNLYGLDIDKRAYQLAYFSVYMKARKYNRRIFSDCKNCNLYYFSENVEIKESTIESFGHHLSPNEQKYAKDKIKYILGEFRDSDVIGSLIRPEEIDYELLNKYVQDYSFAGQMSFDTYEIERVQKYFTKMLKITSILSQKYEAIITNPPYLNSRYMPNSMKEYLENNFKQVKSDMFSAFVLQSKYLCSNDGHVGMLTPYVWMFISGYEELRNILLEDSTISTVAQLEYNAFEAACVPVCAFTYRNGKHDINGTYIRLSDFKGADVQGPKTLNAVRDTSVSYRFNTSQKIYNNIPGKPIAYWVSDSFIDNFNRGISIDTISDFTGSQNITADNDTYLKQWWEVPYELIQNEKWKLYAKGGEFRKWYGNLDLVVDWSDRALDFYKNNKSSNLLNERYWNQEGITYTEFTSSYNTFRYLPPKCIFDKKGPSIVRLKKLEYCMAILNSPVADMYFKVFNPSVSTQVRDVKNLPLIFDTQIEEKVYLLVRENISLAKEDWDSNEKSIDFQENPLVKLYKKENKKLEEVVTELTKYQCKQFEKMKLNEEELNRMIIASYGLEEELHYKVQDDYVSYSKKNDDDIIKELISYAIGCIFGRYSLETPGILEINKSYIREENIYDHDNILPITDEEYLADDIVGKISEFIRAAFGKDSYEENMKYIARILDKNAKNAIDAIRKFMLKDFYDYHCKVYSKRPIYWMVNAGKNNSFKALFYIHRYDEDLFGNLRVDYLHRIQKAIEVAKERAIYVKDNSSSNSDKAMATKNIEKYTNQLKEIQQFDEALANIAMKRIHMDVVIGVKKNYELFQNVTIESEGIKARAVDLLAKVK